MSDSLVLNELLQVMRQLRAPGGCPWDAEQTHESLIPHLLEESHEVIEAIRNQDTENLKEELGDLLLQPVFHAVIAEEAGQFTFADVAKGIVDKLIRRHPHVFGDQKLESSEQVLSQWEAIKRQEKGDQAPQAYLQGIPKGLPSLMRAQKIQKKVAKVGFDWPELEPVVAKVKEELGEVLQAHESADRAAIHEEIGDLLFAAVNLARQLGVDAELALADANRKFERRFNGVEQQLQVQGKSLEQSSLEEMDAAWNEVKRLEH